MNDQNLVCVILAAGLGTRMKSATPKALHKLAGRPLLNWVLAAAEGLAPKDIVVVAPPDCPAIEQAAAPYKIVVQEKPRGTGDAVKAALAALEGFTGDVLVLLGDTPLLSAGMMRGLLETRREGEDTSLAVLGVQFPEEADIPPFGRLVLDKDDTLSRIVEDKDCTEEQRTIRLCNTGAICVDGRYLKGWIGKIGHDNAQGEYYLTDLPEIAAREGKKTRVAILYDTAEALGINSRADLAVLEAAAQDKLRAAALAGGATLMDPASVYFSYDTKIGRDVVVEPHVFFAPDVTIENNVTIRSFSHLEGAVIKEGAVIGPFARLRPGTEIGADSKIGNFVEVKNAKLGDGVKANHLGYIGDADIGAGVNFSCGAITVNYDGAQKHRTTVGAGAMIGSNVNLVAPVEIGEGAYIAAGSTIAKDVPADALAVAREKPLIKEGWAARRREKRTG